MVWTDEQLSSILAFFESQSAKPTHFVEDGVAHRTRRSDAEAEYVPNPECPGRCKNLDPMSNDGDVSCRDCGVCVKRPVGESTCPTRIKEFRNEQVEFAENEKNDQRDELQNPMRRLVHRAPFGVCRCCLDSMESNKDSALANRCFYILFKQRCEKFKEAVDGPLKDVRKTAKLIKENLGKAKSFYRCGRKLTDAAGRVHGALVTQVRAVTSNLRAVVKVKDDILRTLGSSVGTATEHAEFKNMLDKVSQLCDSVFEKERKMAMVAAKASRTPLVSPVRRATRTQTVGEAILEVLAEKRGEARAKELLGYLNGMKNDSAKVGAVAAKLDYLVDDDELVSEVMKRVVDASGAELVVSRRLCCDNEECRAKMWICAETDVENLWNVQTVLAGVFAQMVERASIGNPAALARAVSQETFLRSDTCRLRQRAFVSMASVLINARGKRVFGDAIDYVKHRLSVHATGMALGFWQVYLSPCFDGEAPSWCMRKWLSFVVAQKKLFVAERGRAEIDAVLLYRREEFVYHLYHAENRNVFVAKSGYGVRVPTLPSLIFGSCVDLKNFEYKINQILKDVSTMATAGSSSDNGLVLRTHTCRLPYADLSANVARECFGAGDQSTEAFDVSAVEVRHFKMCENENLFVLIDAAARRIEASIPGFWAKTWGDLGIAATDGGLNTACALLRKMDGQDYEFESIKEDANFSGSFNPLLSCAIMTGRGFAPVPVNDNTPDSQARRDAQRHDVEHSFEVLLRGARVEDRLSPTKRNVDGTTALDLKNAEFKDPNVETWAHNVKDAFKTRGIGVQAFELVCMDGVLKFLIRTPAMWPTVLRRRRKSALELFVDVSNHVDAKVDEEKLAIKAAKAHVLGLQIDGDEDQVRFDAHATWFNHLVDFMVKLNIGAKIDDSSADNTLFRLRVFVVFLCVVATSYGTAAEKKAADVIKNSGYDFVEKNFDKARVFEVSEIDLFVEDDYFELPEDKVEPSFGHLTTFNNTAGERVVVNDTGPERSLK